MHSSISSFERPGFVRRTASDRPGVAQPVPERDVPDQPWHRIAIVALVLLVLLMAGWEAYWRDFGAVPGYYNDAAHWSAQRHRINRGEGGKTVLTGSSRVLFDVQLDVWEQVTGERPIQLALEGTSPLPVIEGLAEDPDFTGKLVVGVTPGLFFSGFTFRANVFDYTRREGPSQRIGHWLSVHLIEPYFAFFDADFALGTVVLRQDWPAREGLHASINVRKLMVQQDPDRNAHLWRKVETDIAYRNWCRMIWSQYLDSLPPPMATPARKKAVIEAQVARAVAALAKLRARGVKVVFLRSPSVGDYYASEQKFFARGETWEPLLAATKAPGVHFDDYPQLQGYELPEWSHMTQADARRYTAQLAPLLANALR
ncbi:MAG: hypothetical protein V4463_25240 [Pseudomonadota bacterium]